jgi:hypothetical protein
MLKGFLVMGTILEFKPKTKQVPVTFWDRYKDVLRKYYSENDVHLIVAAIMDTDCYERTNDDIRKVADIYYKFAPEK